MDILDMEDHIARLGGDEFAVLLPHVNCEHLLEMVQRMRANLDGLIQSMPPIETIIGVSMGWAVLQPGEDMASLLKRSDHQMVAEKTAKRRMHVEEI